MTYKCSTCEHTAEMAGNCPSCNTPLQEVAADTSTETPATDTTASTEATDSSSDASKTV